MSNKERVAENWLAEHYEWDKSGRGYIGKEDGRLCFISDVMATYAAERNQQLVDALKAAQALISTMETCHICKGELVMQEEPVHCEDCSFDCEEHEEPECTTIQSLHVQAKKLVCAALHASGETS